MSLQQNDRSALPWALLAVLLWSTVAAAFKLALRELSPWDLLTYGAVISWLVLGGIRLIRKKPPEEKSPPSWGWAAAAAGGLITPLLYYGMLFAAYHRLPGQTAQPLNYTWPLFLGFLAWPLTGVRPPLRSMGALGISFAGVLVVIGPWGEQTGGGGDPAGTALALGSGIIWAGYWLLFKRLPGDRLDKLFWGAAAAVVVLVPLWILQGGGRPQTPAGWLAVLWTGLFEMGITFLVWSRALEQAANPAKIGNLAYLGPFVSLLWLRLVVGETIRPATLAGLGIIVLGILWGQRQPRQKS